MIENAQRTMGLAGITAGATFFLGQGGELVFGDDSSLLFTIIVVLMGVAVVGFGVAFLAMRQVLHSSRAGRIGATIGVVGDVFLLGFAVQLAISAARTGEVPGNFALFALGFLMVFVAHLMVARPLRAVIGGSWWLSIAAGITLLTALVVNEIFIWHDLALFAFEACWIAIGTLAVKGAGRPLVREAASALP